MIEGIFALYYWIFYVIGHYNLLPDCCDILLGS
jgi:hypothetical protein